MLPQCFIEGGVILRVLHCSRVYTQLPWTATQSALQIRPSTWPPTACPGCQALHTAPASSCLPKMGTSTRLPPARLGWWTLHTAPSCPPGMGGPPYHDTDRLQSSASAPARWRPQPCCNSTFLRFAGGSVFPVSDIKGESLMCLVFLECLI